MSIDGISLLKSPSSVAWTGGTATVFENDSTSVRNGIHVADTSNDDFLTRDHMTFKSRSPVRQKDGSFSKGTRDINVTMPITLADGSIAYNVARTTYEIHPETSAAQLSTLRHYSGQTALDSELDKFFTIGTTK